MLRNRLVFAAWVRSLTHEGTGEGIEVLMSGMQMVTAATIGVAAWFSG